MSTRALLAVALCLVACDRAEPPRGPSTAGAGSGEPSPGRPHRRLNKPRRDGEAPPAAPTASAGSNDAGIAPDAGAVQADAGAAAADAGAAALAPPPLHGSDGALLPQTEADPSESSPWFQAGLRALFRAIQADDPKLAEAFFFPLAAYEQVKDVKDPKRDWERRLLANFRRDIHDYHARLGPDAAGARFVGVELNAARKKWMKPRSEGNKLGYFRVTRNRLRYEDAKGKAASLEITSLISWRGEWYLVHLNGFE